MLGKDPVAAVAEQVLGAGGIDGVMDGPGGGGNPAGVVQRQVGAERPCDFLLEGVVERIAGGGAALGGGPETQMTAAPVDERPVDFNEAVHAFADPARQVGINGFSVLDQFTRDVDRPDGGPLQMVDPITRSARLLRRIGDNGRQGHEQTITVAQRQSLEVLACGTGGGVANSASIGVELPRLASTELRDVIRIGLRPVFGMARSRRALIS